MVKRCAADDECEREATVPKLKPQYCRGHWQLLLAFRRGIANGELEGEEVEGAERGLRIGRSTIRFVR